MGTLILHVSKEIARALPAAFVRALLLGTVIGAGYFHYRGMQRVTALEQWQASTTAQNSHVISSVNELAAEVRGYRADILEQNKILRNKGVQGLNGN